MKQLGRRYTKELAEAGKWEQPVHATCSLTISRNQSSEEPKQASPGGGSWSIGIFWVGLCFVANLYWHRTSSLLLIPILPYIA